MESPFGTLVFMQNSEIYGREISQVGFEQAYVRSENPYFSNKCVQMAL